MQLPSHKTKIVATIGPASDSPEIMEQMIRAGMSVARLNFSHGDFPRHQTVIADLRTAAQAAGHPLTIMADLPGPKMRIGQLAMEPIELKAGDTFTLTVDEIVGDASRVSVTFDRLPQCVKPGDLLFLNDGIIQISVVAVEGGDVRCRVEVGGELRSRKGLNLPGIDLGICAFTERDRECLRFALENGAEAISQSFVESAADIKAVREAAAALGYAPFIIAKIERSNALDHFDEILAAADGIMIARGDLGVEVPIEQIAVIQKGLMFRANLLGKPVITATQMLESMTASRRPTRAEATDVANAILDGTDCVMLSGESAVGAFPVDAVAMLAKIAQTVEPMRPGLFVRDTLKARGRERQATIADAMALSVDTTLEHVPSAAVIVSSRSGATARSIARFRLPVWVVAVSDQETTCEGLQFSYGIYQVYRTDLPEDWSTFTRQWLRDARENERELTGDVAVLVAGPSPAHPEANHRMEIIALK